MFMHVSHGNGSQIERGSTPPHHPEPGGPAAQNHPEKKRWNSWNIMGNQLQGKLYGNIIAGWWVQPL